MCDTPVHKGQRGVTMATNFGTKIAINAYECISTRDNEDAITYNGTLPRQRNCGQNRPKITKMAITSVVCNISVQSLVLR